MSAHEYGGEISSPCSKMITGQIGGVRHSGRWWRVCRLGNREESCFLYTGRWTVSCWNQIAWNQWLPLLVAHPTCLSVLWKAPQWPGGGQPFVIFKSSPGKPVIQLGWEPLFKASGSETSVAHKSQLFLIIWDLKRDSGLSYTTVKSSLFLFSIFIYSRAYLM